MDKEYYLGLDMGTSSVGWAVTDTEYNLLRAKGKDLWGVRLFNEASTAADRRTFRTSRRRLQREKARIGSLRELFADEINKVDLGFYQRLDDSKYFREDKAINQPFALFADTGFTDKEYYEKYPTIFHLRKELIEDTTPHDVRLVFLAILNMYKHRGHFLNANLGENGMPDLNELVDCFTIEMYDTYEINIEKSLFTEALHQVLPSSQFTKSKKAEEINKICNFKKTEHKDLIELVKLICGLQGKVSTAFSKETFDEDGKKFSLSFRDGNLEDKLVQAESILTEEAYEILLVAKQIHDWGILSNIMTGDNKTYQYLSQARVDMYDKHNNDLKILKKLYKENQPSKKKDEPTEYAMMFREMHDNNYSAYVGSVNSGREIARRGAKSKVEDFYSNVKKAVSKMPESEEKAYVLSEIEKETFLPKQLTTANGTIPNQVHKAELKAILNNAKMYLPFLNEKDDSGLSVAEKIVALFEFQIPYYVGPLVNDGTGNAWVVRKESGKVLPWNFDEKVDQKASAEKFIEKMVNHRTYLNDETVLPKNSLLYEKYMVLNELNNLKINGMGISVELKQNLYNDEFKKGKKVTQKKLKDYLINNGYVDNKTPIEISGIDGDFVNTLANHKKFANILNVESLTDGQREMVEDIIFWATIYGDSKKFLQERIEEAYGDVITAAQIKRIIGIKFKDWGRFSKEFLQLEGYDKETGDIQPIIGRMWTENLNLMEMLSNKFTYLDAIKEKSHSIEKQLMDIEYEDLDELYISAPVKRMTWQTMLIVKELYKVLGSEPKKIFIEMARDANAEKTRTLSRKKKFADLYKNCKDDDINWSNEISSREESEFRSKKLYLYYTQKGKCMYTGEQINLHLLMNSNDVYDIDHIYPRHFVKDDSIENNLVLVNKHSNSRKSDTYPIEQSIRENRHSMWKALKDGNFITAEKYNRLVRNTEFTDEEKAAFINRQIVETRQGTKAIADLFKNTFKDTEVVYVKAGNVSDFRRKNDLLKCREVNDFHHANDAYLNVVVGNTYNVKFTKKPINFIKEYNRDKQKNNYHMDHMFDYNVVRGDDVAWIADNGKSISIVKKVMSKNTPLITKMNYEAHGGFADQTIYSAKKAAKAKGEGYIPVKTSNATISDVTKYGGFTKVAGTYFFLVEHKEKGKLVRTIEPMPLYLCKKIESTADIEEYCKTELGYIEPSVRLKKIKMNSFIKVDGYYLYLTGRSGKQLIVSNGMPLVLSYEHITYIRNIAKCIGKNFDIKEMEKLGIIHDENLRLYDVLNEKHNKSIYSKRPNPVASKLDEGRELFENLDLDKQVKILSEILKLTMLSNMGADLSMIGASTKTGMMFIGKKISGKSEFKLINKSITGLYENEIDLLTI